MDRRPYVLGLDIGSASIGWAALRLDGEGNPAGFLTEPDGVSTPSIGVRIFDCGVEGYGLGSKESPRNLARRQARQQRRQAARRARRIRKTFNSLVRHGLLPDFPEVTKDTRSAPEVARDQLIKTLDAQFSTKYSERFRSRRQVHTAHARLPYLLRSLALDSQPIPLFEVGRALYHLGQRRGYRGSKRQEAEGSGKEDKKGELGKVKQQILDIEKSIESTGARSLGEFLFREPHGSRLRCRWTSRKMYEDEFDAIWTSQSGHHPKIMTEAARKEIRRAIFHQRPLKSVAHLIGSCELEDGSTYVNRSTGEMTTTRRRRRARMCDPLSQEFRLYQKINDLEWRESENDEYSKLTPDDRRIATEVLRNTSRVSFPELKKLLGMKRGTKFNFENGGEKFLRGLRTEIEVNTAVGGLWTTWDEGTRLELLAELWHFDDPDTIQQRINNRTGPLWSRLQLPEDMARRLALVVLEDDYCSLSRHALKRVLPQLEAGVPYATAIKATYGERWSEKTFEVLPAVSEVFKGLRNPVVDRALSELRRVVNALIKVYGRPEVIRVELARDLKKSREDRNKLLNENRDREKVREKAREAVASHIGTEHVKGGDILRQLLWDECGGVCPYTGACISKSSLFNGSVDIEHIIPFSRSLDDSFLNKTLCFSEVNRNEKRNQTPWEAFHGHSTRWGEMCARIDRMVANGTMSATKARRFKFDAAEVEEFCSGFANSSLNDTRHASVKAKSYLSLLYGSRNGLDSSGRMRVQVGNGQVTAFLRRAYSLNRLLGGDSKIRSDHRHHAVDAIAIALTSQAIMRTLSVAAQRNTGASGRIWGDFPMPWDDFLDICQAHINSVIVSAKVTNRIRGAIHKETHFAPPITESGTRIEGCEGSILRDARTKSRKRLEALSASDIEEIVDPVVARLVQEKLRLAGSTNPQDVFDPSRPETLPGLPNRNGGSIPIRSVRVWRRASVFPVSGGHRIRFVQNDDNHHLVVFEVESGKKKKWIGRIVTRFEAYRRRRSGIKIVDRSNKLKETFLFSLSKGEYIVIRDSDDAETIVRIDSIGATAAGTIDIEARRHSDARTSKERREQGARLRFGLERLKTLNMRRISVSPIGEVRRNRG